MGLSALVAEGARLGLFEGTHRLAYLSHGQLVGGGYLAAAGLAVCVLYVGAGVHGVAGDPLHHGAQLLSQQLRALGDYLVIAGHVQQVGYLHVCAVLGHLHLYVALGQSLAGRGNALLKCLHGVVCVKEVPLAEFHPLAAVLGNGALLAVLGVYKAGLGAFQQLAVVKGLVELGGACGVCGSVDTHYFSPSFLCRYSETRLPSLAARISLSFMRLNSLVGMLA